MAVVPINSIRCLEWRLNVPRKVLYRTAERIEKHYYTHNSKVGEKVRVFEVPTSDLKLLQRRINRLVLDEYIFPPYVCGSVRKRSPLDAAARHTEKKFLAHIDIKDFFPSVCHDQVYGAFRNKLACGHPVAGLLTRLTTIGRHLPQGAPTSSSLANLVLLDVDERINALASRLKLAYSRYVDDLHLSGDSREALNTLIAETIFRLRAAGFRVGRKKLKTSRRDDQQQVTGYTTNSQKPSVPRKKRDRVRASIHRLSKMEVDSRDAMMLVDSIRGSIAYFRRSNPGHASRLEEKLQTVLDPH